jgi:phosphate transport system protein
MTRVIDPVMKELRELLLLMGSRAEAILDKALRALVERNAALAAQVLQDDLEIDRLDVKLDDKVIQALALQAPVASDLREVVAVKMMATDLERVGDLARNIAKSAARLAQHAELPLPATLTSLARSAQEMLRRSLNAFAGNDAALAREVLDADDALDAVQDELVRKELEGIAAHPDQASGAVDVIFVAKNLERVGDHATNVAEDVILIVEARNVKHAAKLRG